MEKCLSYASDTIETHGRVGFETNLLCIPDMQYLLESFIIFLFFFHPLIATGGVIMANCSAIVFDFRILINYFGTHCGEGIFNESSRCTQGHPQRILEIFKGPRLPYSECRKYEISHSYARTVQSTTL